jgi:antitoxin ParD1/3/4
MATRNINLTDALDRFVAELIQSGSYQNASEVVRAGLRLLKAEEETRARKLAALNAAIQEGLDDVAAGRVIEIDNFSAWLDEIDAEVEAEIAAEDAAAARTPAE